MVQPRGYPTWEELYRNDEIEKLPWYSATLDPDIEAALARHGVRAGRVLDQGTGPGTQAMALAARGFDVTATDVSEAALAYARRKAKERGVAVTFVQDDVLASRLAAPFDVVVDRGCFHVVAPDRRDAFVASIHRLLAPSGWLLLKTFSHRQPGVEGPYRFTPDELRSQFEGGGRFEIRETIETEFQGQLDPFPKAIFCVMRRGAAR